MEDGRTRNKRQSIDDQLERHAPLMWFARVAPPVSVGLTVALLGGKSMLGAVVVAVLVGLAMYAIVAIIALVLAAR